MSDIVLRYKRDFMDTSTGEIYILSDTNETETLFSFEQIDFPHMMSKFAYYLQENLESGALIERTDRVGLIPFRLEPATIHLLRTDPVTIIRSMSYPHKIVDMRKPKKNVVLAEQHIRTGQDTLAEAFGDYIYSAAKEDGTVECPCCGRWKVRTEPSSNDLVKAICSNCDFQEIGKFITTKDNYWLRFGTKSMLFFGDRYRKTRFFFPRSWNPYCGWISREELVDMYNKYRAEMTNV